MYDLWDWKADCIKKGENSRDITPIMSKTRLDDNGFTHFVFSKTMFSNPKFTIQEDDYELFKKFLDGGSREYPSDGNLPADIAATEANIVLDKFEEIANNPNHYNYESARKELERNGKLGLVRGTIKLYLGNYTTRDWRRKRFTNDIDFWVFNKNLLENVLRETGWNKNNKTKEYEKKIKWVNFVNHKIETTILIASNDINQLLNFGACSYIDGPTLKDIVKKKLMRGHDVDLSDIINIAIVNNTEVSKMNEEWINSWRAFEESANARSARITSNMISLCRLSYGIADYLERVGNVIAKYCNIILEKSKYSDDKIISVCKASSHHLAYDLPLKANEARNKIYNNMIAQKSKKIQYSKNLRNFASRVLELLNSKYKHVKIIFEIEN